MKKRLPLKFIGYSGLTMFVMFPVNSISIFVEMKNRIRNRFRKLVAMLLDSQRIVTVLLENGVNVSVETALNSRCSSDYDDAQELFHWGIFNRYEKLSTEQINRIVGYIRIPRLTNYRTEVRVNGNVLTFVVDNTISGIQRDWLMVESGMHQQAACLICAALGVGMVFKGFGENGKSLSETDHATVRIKLDAMKPSYTGLYWNTQPPNSTRSWLKENLPVPNRVGTESLIQMLSVLSPQNNGLKQVVESQVGQLLWAARGRTPHLYNSRAWGLTIPTSQGEQDNTYVNLLEEDRLSRYVNWSGGRPTHSIKKNKNINHDLSCKLRESLTYKKFCIILCGNGHSEKVFWETGYQLLNILLQARALSLNYKTQFLDERQKNFVTNTGVGNPIVAVSF